MSKQLINSFTPTNENKLNCVVVGDGTIGKTSMIAQFMQKRFNPKYSPTVYDKYFVSFEVAKETYHMEIRDTSGQIDYTRLRSLGYSDVDTFILCFSVGDKTSYENITSKWIPEIKKYSPQTPFLLVGLKTDLRLEHCGCTEKEKFEPICYKTGAKLAAKLNKQKCFNYAECSTVTDVGVQNVFREAVLTFLHCRDAQQEKAKKWSCNIL